MLENRQKELTDPLDRLIHYKVECICLKSSYHNMSETAVVFAVRVLRLNEAYLERGLRHSALRSLNPSSPAGHSEAAEAL